MRSIRRLYIADAANAVILQADPTTSMKQAATILCILFSNLLQAQTPDVQHYHFAIELSDLSDTIKGNATITYKMPAAASSVQLNLKNISGGRGMKVQSVNDGVNELPFQHRQNILDITVAHNRNDTASKTLRIRYAGIPADGLIISKNKYGDRTFFADNWPNRAHNWIPCNDRPDDKASVAFEITAPAHYQVVSNGLQQEETHISGEIKRTLWAETTPIPTKVMVIGVARMAVAQLDSALGVPVSAWVYPQNRNEGFHDYALTARMLQFFSEYVGPYAFKKLANVQSKTDFGGMENASAIFYAENTVTGDRRHEDLMAHEVAHQWFGNMATEKSFAHLWLSEGFATYLTNIYLEHQYGIQRLQDRLRKDREAVIRFVHRNDVPVVHQTSDLMSLLNANSYEKGGWVLHMLRRQVGDTIFQKIIQTYYARFEGGNAETEDFQKVAEELSGKKLDEFFQQWLYNGGLPRLLINWRYNRGQVQVTVQQIGENLFRFPLEIGFVNNAGQQTLHRLDVSRIKESFTIPAAVKPTVLIVDPNVNLLFDGTVREER